MTATEKLIANIFEQNYIENPSKYEYENRVEPLVDFVSGIAYDLYENRSKEDKERDDKEEIELIDYIYIGLNTIHDMISKTFKEELSLFLLEEEKIGWTFNLETWVYCDPNKTIS